MNPAGRPENLRAQQPGNTNALRHGAYSTGIHAPRAREVADALLESAFILPVDRFGAEEVGRIVSQIEVIDGYLAEKGPIDARGKPHPILDYRIRLSRQLERLLNHYLATPGSRARLAERLTAGEDPVAILRRELEQGVALLEAARDRGDLQLPSPEELP